MTTRRDFLAASAAVAGMSALSAVAAEGEQPMPREFYELRIYTPRTEEQQDRLERHVRDALVPALNRQGVRPVGVFREQQPSDPPRLFLLISYPTLDAFVNAGPRPRQDMAYQYAAADFLALPDQSLAV